jgi:hypothetical protein
MEAGGRADEIGLLLEGGARGKLGVFKHLDGGEVLVEQGGRKSKRLMKLAPFSRSTGLSSHSCQLGRISSTMGAGGLMK